MIWICLSAFYWGLVGSSCSRGLQPAVPLLDRRGPVLSSLPPMLVCCSLLCQKTQPLFVCGLTDRLFYWFGCVCVHMCVTPSCLCCVDRFSRSNCELQTLSKQLSKQAGFKWNTNLSPGCLHYPDHISGDAPGRVTICSFDKLTRTFQTQGFSSNSD